MGFGFRSGVLFCFGGFVWNCVGVFFYLDKVRFSLIMPPHCIWQGSLSFSPNCSSNFVSGCRITYVKRVSAWGGKSRRELSQWWETSVKRQLHMKLGCSVGAWWVPDISLWIYRLWICECSGRDMGPTATAQKHWGKILIYDLTHPGLQLDLSHRYTRQNSPLGSHCVPGLKTRSPAALAETARHWQPLSQR